MFDKHYSKYYELFNQDKPYKKEIEFVYEWAGKPKWIFDIGCGTGNYFKYYPKGTQIIGIEKSGFMVNHSKDLRIMRQDITRYKHFGRFDCATALFDVINYIPNHDWWKNIPIDRGGYFIFDVFNAEKVDKEGFQKTVKKVGNLTRTIQPIFRVGKTVSLDIKIEEDGHIVCDENHAMLIYSHEDIEKFCGKEFQIVETKETERWQKWYKLKRK